MSSPDGKKCKKCGLHLVMTGRTQKRLRCSHCKNMSARMAYRKDVAYMLLRRLRSSLSGHPASSKMTVSANDVTTVLRMRGYDMERDHKSLKRMRIVPFDGERPFSVENALLIPCGSHIE